MAVRWVQQWVAQRAVSTDKTKAARMAVWTAAMKAVQLVAYLADKLADQKAAKWVAHSVDL